MAETTEFYGELMATGLRADTGQQSVTVLGSDGKKRLVNFIVHGGDIKVDLTTHVDSPLEMLNATLTAYIYTSDGNLEQAVNFPNVWDSVADASESTQAFRRMQAIFAAAPADYISGASPSGGYAYVLYGPGIELVSYAAGQELTACGLAVNTDTTLPDPDPLNRIVLALAPYALKRIDVVSGAITDFTPAPLGTLLTRGDMLFSGGPDPTTGGYYSISIPPLAYKQMFYACTSCVLAYGDQVWWGHEEPAKFPTTLEEMGEYSGGTVDVPGTPEIIVNATFPTSVVTFSGQQVVKHQFGARHDPFEAFKYTFTPLADGVPLSITHPAHLVSHVHPKELPSQDNSLWQWAWTVDLDPGTGVDPQAEIPDYANVGDRYNMISGCVSVDTPFLFTNSQRRVTVINATEEAPSPAPSATQFVVPIRDGSGLSKDWRWYQNMPGANPFYGVPTGVIHLYLVDPVLGLWKYMGPAKESTGATGTLGTNTGADGPYLTSQRTSRVVNLNGVLAATSVFGAMKPTKSDTLRSGDRHGSGSLTGYPPSADSAVGYTEELWLVCSNDGTNWVKVAKLTERWQDLASDKKGDSISLRAGSTKLIGYGPRNLPIASAPCLLRKPVI